MPHRPTPNRLLRRLADWLILRPTRDPVDPESRQRLTVTMPGSDQVLELFGRLTKPMATGESDRPVGSGPPHRPLDGLILKFPGTGGRAEWAGPHPADAWDDLALEVWAVNMPGYGQSTPPAALPRMPAAALAAFDAIASRQPGVPVLVCGNSIGTAYALYVAAHRPVSALLLRDPVPLRELLVDRGAWWNLWLAPLLARAIPDELDSVANARDVTCPALVLTAVDDTLVYARLQRLITARLAQVLTLEMPGCDHGEGPPDHQLDDYAHLLQSLRERVWGDSRR